MPTRRHSVLLFCLAGLTLVLFSEPLGMWFVQRPHGENGYTWNQDEARRAAEVVRWLGALLFATGLTERIVRAVERSGRAASTEEEPAP